ncbi:hypothetical protein KIW84_040634 [Lathyrus oleraceus]|uniref:Uncharacterized protein n=1 Tax=Pisum sativum TaxID=3888 RepID=A0A9D4X7L8_PEA|nr:hypothetical protein KIW84_040634 [Pisum sativum]
MLQFSIETGDPKSTVMSNSYSFMDPTIGFYCQMLATKNSTRNAVGEQNSTILVRWATLMTITTLKRCGKPLEALEYFSSSLSMLGTADQANELGDDLSSTLKPLPRKSSNWLFADVYVHLEFHVKLNLALCYLSKLIREHPSWPVTFIEFDGEGSYSEESMIQYEKSNDSFKQKLYARFDLLEQKYLLTPCYLISMILLLLCHHGLWYIGYDVTDGSTLGELSQKKSDRFDVSILSHSQFKPLFKTAEEISFLYSRFFSAYAWLSRKPEALLFMVQPFLIAHDGRNPYEVDMVNLKNLISKVAQLLGKNSFITNMENLQLLIFLLIMLNNLRNGSNVMTLEWLRQTSQSEPNHNENLDVFELVNRKDNHLAHQLLWDHYANPKLILNCFAQEKLNWSKDSDHKPIKEWNDLYTIMKGLYKTDDSHNDESKVGKLSANHDIEPPLNIVLCISSHANSAAT